MNHFIRIALLMLVAVLLSTPEAFCQGTLTPPGPPAPSMKSLDVIEPRTPISSAPYAISSPGSYYLTTNLNVTTGNVISIVTNGVTLDLSGFTLSSSAPNANGAGIDLALANGNSDITILNGHIRGGVTNNGGIYYGSGLASGIVYSGALPSNIRVAGVSVAGCYYVGIYLNDGSSGAPYSTIVESCTVQTIAMQGIYASEVSHSAAYDCGSAAIAATTATDCRGYSTGSGPGVYAATANNCYGYCSGSGDGLDATNANNCYGYCTGGGSGLNADNANNCYGQSSGGRGLSATSAVGCYGVGAGGGVYAFNANGCYAKSTLHGVGLFAWSANSCMGDSPDGNGVAVLRIAIGCHGYTTSSSPGLESAEIAIGCYGFSAAGYGLAAFIANTCAGSSIDPATHKYNMP